MHFVVQQGACSEKVIVALKSVIVSHIFMGTPSPSPDGADVLDVAETMLAVIPGQDH